MLITKYSEQGTLKAKWLKMEIGPMIMSVVVLNETINYRRCLANNILLLAKKSENII